MAWGSESKLDDESMILCESCVILYPVESVNNIGEWMGFCLEDSGLATLFWRYLRFQSRGHGLKITMIDNSFV